MTVPVRNEATRIAHCLLELKRVFDASGLDYGLAVAEDGSTDGTQRVLDRLRGQIPDLLVQTNPRALGRGRALRMLWSAVDADVYCFTDADLASGAEAVVDAVERVLDGESIVVGSRYVRGARLDRPPVRAVVSRAYNRILRFAFDEPIQDHQCGLKAFSGDAVRELLPRSKEDSWFWDTEIIVLAFRWGFPVREVPVAWKETKTKRTRWARLLSDVYLHGTGLLRLRTRLDGEGVRRTPVPTGSAVRIEARS